MSFTDDLLLILTNYPEGYRLMRADLVGRSYGGPKNRALSRDKVSPNTVRVTLSRLKAKGLVNNDKGLWKITRVGRDYLSSPVRLLRRRRGGQRNSRPKNMIICFDVPEKSREKRDWLRTELHFLGFIMLQKSVWYGPSPLSEEFVNALHDFGLLPHMKFFNAREADVV